MHYTSNTNGTVSKTPDVNSLLDKQADMMNAAQAAGQAVAQRIGDYADAQANATGDLGWKEGGDSRAELHVAGGALIGGLGGGSAFSTIGGAAGAGMASKMAGTLDDISKGVASATGSDLIGNLAANIAAGVGGAAVGGTAGAAMASNVHLYNQSVDDERALTGDLGNKTTSLFSLAMQGIANGLSAIVGMGGGGPPAASPGAVLVNGAGQALAAGAGSAALQPDNATLNVQENREKGRAWENKTVDAYEKQNPEVVQEVTVRVADGTKTRLDILTRDPNGTIGCVECKSSATAPLTNNQIVAFPQIADSGAVIVGKGKPGFPRGTVIPPTEVKIVRPPTVNGGK